MTLGQSADFLKYFLSTLPEESPEGADSEWIESDNQLKEALRQAIRCMNNVDFALKDIENFDVIEEWEDCSMSFQLGACKGMDKSADILRDYVLGNNSNS